MEIKILLEELSWLIGLKLKFLFFRVRGKIDIIKIEKERNKNIYIFFRIMEVIIF